MVSAVKTAGQAAGNRRNGREPPVFVFHLAGGGLGMSGSDGGVGGVQIFSRTGPRAKVRMTIFNTMMLGERPNF